ncbi:MAG: 30S ribosomal protein S18 [Candidatus Brocadiales bacterium]
MYKKENTIKRYSKFNKKCRFCRMGIEEIDYKDLPTLQKLTGSQGKLFSRKRSGNCARHQRATIIALKRARFMALLPYVA